MTPTRNRITNTIDITNNISFSFQTSVNKICDHEGFPFTTIILIILIHALQRCMSKKLLVLFYVWSILIR